MNNKSVAREKNPVFNFCQAIYTDSKYPPYTTISVTSQQDQRKKASISLW